MNRRGFLRTALVGGIALHTSQPVNAQSSSSPFGSAALELYSQRLQLEVARLPELGYPLAALEPAVDGLTMQIHHDRHHAAYVNNLTAALKGSGLEWSLARLAAQYAALPAALQTPARNNAGGHLNHSLFWSWLKPGGARAPLGQTAALIKQSFGSVENLKTQFFATATGRFGSGWAWLLLERGGTLRLASTANQDTPLVEGSLPLLGVDVWEHAYYLKYQNKRADYLAALWEIINWDRVEELYRLALEVYALG